MCLLKRTYVSEAKSNVPYCNIFLIIMYIYVKRCAESKKRYINTNNATFTYMFLLDLKHPDNF